MARLGCLLLIVAFASLCVLVVLPVLPFFAESSALDTLLQPILCQSGETIQRKPYSTRSSRGGTSFSMDVYCIDSREHSRDVTGQWEFISMAAFLVPFLVGLFGVVVGANRKVRRLAVAGTASSLNRIGLDTSNLKVEALNVSRPGQTAHLTLAERLKQIGEARNAGLISADEYERLRKEILDDGI